VCVCVKLNVDDDNIKTVAQNLLFSIYQFHSELKSYS